MQAERGFTLAELTIVMVIVGVLAAVAVPRLFNRNEFAARAASDFVASSLRYAQKTAIAMRRNVCVGIAGSTVTIDYASAAGSDQPCAPANVLTHPVNNLPFADPANALSGGSTVSVAATLGFDALGRPFVAPSVALANPVSIAVNGYALPVVVEPESGLVH